MNKQELLEEIVKLDIEVSENFSHYDLVNKEVVLALIDQLDELQKPVVPQFVADYIEKWKHEGLTIYEWFAFDINDSDQDVDEWLYDNTTGENTRREYLLFDAIRFGYKVEKEPVYFAKIKGHELVETETILDEDTGDDISDFCRNVYFVLQKDGQIIVDMKDSGLSGAKHIMTMNQWNSLGINETNADFEMFIAPHG